MAPLQISWTMHMTMVLELEATIKEKHLMGLQHIDLQDWLF